MIKWISKNIKKFNKTSIWFKVFSLLILLLLIYHAHGSKNMKEPFIQQKKFIIKEGSGIYDKFYSNIYDSLVFDKVKNDYEVGEIINTTKPTQKSRILDIGSGTGQIVNLFQDKGFNAQGLELSSAMVEIAKKNFPKYNFKVGNALETMIYPGNNFTTVTCLYFTIYYIKDKLQFLKNCYHWLMPGGNLVLNLVNRDKFDPILNTADPLLWVSAQKFAKKRITNSIVKFKDFEYKGNFDLDKPNNTATFTETMKDDKTGHIRQNIHKLFMPTQKKILALAKQLGFILKGKADLVNVQYEYQYLYFLYKPE
jgi:ubiquinone/menaquinone biosynthesis C-methylase UbiE